jgi:hypothetical protein
MKTDPSPTQLRKSLPTAALWGAAALLCCGSAAHASTPLVFDSSATSGSNQGFTFLTSAQYSWVDGNSIGQVDGTAVYRLNDRTAVLASLGGALGEGDFRVLSGGLGLRRLVGDGQTMVGVNGFYDSLRDSSGFSYNQVGGGIEVSRGRWFFNANGYIPVGSASRTESVETTETVTEEVRKATPVHEIVTRRAMTVTTADRQALRVADAEIGYRVIDREYLSLTLAAGYYFGWADDLELSGVKARAELGIGQHIGLGAEWRDNGADIGREWLFYVSARCQLGRYDSPAVITDADGFTSGAPAPVIASTPSGKGAKDVMPVMPAKNPKDVIPVAPQMPSMADQLLYQQVRRSPWPSSLVRYSTDFSESFSTRRIPTPRRMPDCDCGPTLIFD